MRRFTFKVTYTNDVLTVDAPSAQIAVSFLVSQGCEASRLRLVSVEAVPPSRNTEPLSEA
jgi:hypothetical protein